jgi:hypothetical protein
MTRQIISKERVAKHGEVFTNEREVNAMLDLVKSETDRVESRFLEPACGDGNFLAEILRRKLDRVKRQYKKHNSEYVKNAFLALTSIYGIDIQEDNVQKCRMRLFAIWNNSYTEQCKKEVNDEIREAAKYILQKNILCGDALTLLQNDGQPIVFAQWDFIIGNKIKRRDYTLNELMKTRTNQLDMEMYLGNWEYDDETKEWIPAPIKEYPLTNYWEVQNAIES